MLSHIRKIIPKKFRKFLRRNYSSYIEPHLEKIKFFNCELKNSEIYINSIFKKKGIEIGGPSFFFRNFLKVYKNIESLDNVNFKSKTLWQNNKNLNSFLWSKSKNKIGKEFICCSTDMSIIPNESYDFILSCHQIEHVANPLKAIKEFRRILKKTGYLILILPNSKFDFDHNRKITTFSHLLDDFNFNISENDLTHLDESLKLTDFTNNFTEFNRFKELAEDNFNNRILHHHIFNYKLIQEVCKFTDFTLLQFDEIKTKFPSLVFLCKKNLQHGVK